MYAEKYGKFGMGIFFTLLAVAYFYLACRLPESAVMKVGPSFVPKIVAAMTFILGVVLTYKGYAVFRAFRPAENAEEANSSYVHVFLTVAAFGLYVYTLETLGFLIGTFIYLVLQMLILSPPENRRPLPAAIVSLVATASIYYIFREGLMVMLPAGVLG
jgi:putative tricarboxylic transport membrane protein